MSAEPKTVRNIRIGKPDIAPDTPSHTPGSREGNKLGAYKRQSGHHDDDRSDARRSTGVHPSARNSIIPGSPNISPS